MFKKPQESLREKYPRYVNNSLSSQEREEVDAVISQDKQARAEVEAWKQIRDAVVSQPQRVPSTLVRQRVMAMIHESTVSLEHKTQYNWSFTVGALLTLSVLILLWLAVRPGVVLQWSLERDGISSYRIYRAAQGSNHFELIKVIPAQSDRLRYSFVDAFLLPGRNYLYRVEGVRSDGVSTLSSEVNGRYQDVMPSQLALMITSVVFGYGIVIVVRRWRIIPQRRMFEYMT